MSVIQSYQHFYDYNVEPIAITLCTNNNNNVLRSKGCGKLPQIMTLVWVGLSYSCINHYIHRPLYSSTTIFFNRNLIIYVCSHIYVICDQAKENQPSWHIKIDHAFQLCYLVTYDSFIQSQQNLHP